MLKNLKVLSSDPGINKSMVHSLITSLKKEFNLNISFLAISFIKTDELRQINKIFLKHDYNTDVITFDYSKKRKEIDAEILISIDDARVNARKFKVTYGKELTRLIIHGMLHLLNFDDKDAITKKTMKKEENMLINKYYFALFASK